MKLHFRSYQHRQERGFIGAHTLFIHLLLLSGSTWGVYPLHNQQSRWIGRTNLTCGLLLCFKYGIKLTSFVIVNLSSWHLYVLELSEILNSFNVLVIPKHVCSDVSQHLPLSSLEECVVIISHLRVWYYVSYLNGFWVSIKCIQKGVWA